MHKVKRKASASLTLVLLAIVGGIAGFAITARKAGACSCSSPAWALQLQSATASDGMSDHKKFWPTDARLEAYDGFAGLRDNAQSPGVVTFLEARR
jgi:hypothetical protein